MIPLNPSLRHARVLISLSLFVPVIGSGQTVLEDFESSAPGSASIVVSAVNQPALLPHPSVISTQLQLEAMRELVLNQQDSVARDEWDQLLQQPWSSLAYVHTPQVIVFVTPSGTNPSEDAFRDDAHAARSHALQWVVTGDADHRDKALQILNDWGNSFENIQMEGGGYATQIQLECAWALPIWVAAGDIVRYFDGGSAGWAQADIAKFASFLQYMYNEARKTRLRTSSNAWASIGKGYHNWSISGNWAMMCYGAWSDDVAIFEEGYNNLLLILDDFSLPTGEINETCRDTIHPQYSIVTLTDAAELANNLGYDGLYSATFDGQSTPRLAVILEYFSNLMLGNTADPCGGIGYAGKYLRFGNYQVPYNHYIAREGRADLPVFRETIETVWNGGTDKHFLLWSRLTHDLESSGGRFWNDTFTGDGNVDTHGWLGLLNVSHSPWIYSYSLDTWIHMPEDRLTEFGAWAHIARPD